VPFSARPDTPVDLVERVLQERSARPKHAAAAHPRDRVEFKNRSQPSARRRKVLPMCPVRLVTYVSGRSKGLQRCRPFSFHDCAVNVPLLWRADSSTSREAHRRSAYGARCSAERWAYRRTISGLSQSRLASLARTFGDRSTHAASFGGRTLERTYANASLLRSGGRGLGAVARQLRKLCPKSRRALTAEG
jgi:hypothetical protein